jgi:hypothetical protein
VQLDVSQRLLEDELRAVTAIGAGGRAVELQLELLKDVSRRDVAHALKVQIDFDRDRCEHQISAVLGM